MKNRKILLIAVCIIFTILIGIIFIMNIKSSKIGELQKTYFKIVEDDINGDVTEVSEIEKKIPESNLDNMVENVMSVEDKEGLKTSYTTKTYEFEKENEELIISYLQKGNRIDSLDFNLKRVGSSEIYLHSAYYKSGKEKGQFSVQIYPKSLEEQMSILGIIDEGLDSSNIYNVYEKISKSIEFNTELEINNIEKMIGKKLNKKIIDDSNNKSLSQYTYKEDKYELYIIYNEDNKMFEEVSISNEDPSKASISYRKGIDYELQVYDSNLDLKEQEELINKIIKENK